VSKVISSDKVKDYKIEKFQFGNLKKTDVSKIIKPVSLFNPEKKENKIVEDNQECSPYKEEYENLLKKVDELTGNIVTLQMQLENEKKEFEQKLVQIKEEAYNQGVKDTQQAQQEELESLKVQYISSITNLQELEIQIKQKLSDFEEELIETSIIIASKVIKKEVEENSSKIAKSIARYLLDDIKDELEVKLLVNPKDYEELLKDNLKENIKIISNNSVTAGGVILLSKDKNLDGTIESRFKKTLQLIKES
jgi:flagellar assembly protein FliH